MGVRPTAPTSRLGRREVLRGGAVAAGALAGGTVFGGLAPASALAGAPTDGADAGPFGVGGAVGGSPQAITAGLTYLTLPTHAFEPVSSSQGRTITPEGAWTSDAAGTLVAPLAFPQGAVIKEMTAWGYNTSGSFQFFYLNEVPLGTAPGTIFATATFPTGAAVVLSSAAGTFSRVVSADSAYFASVATPVTGTVRVQAMRIGYVAPDPGLRFITPTRVYDSRPADPPLGGVKGQLANGASRVLDAKANASGVPASARAVLVNLTVANTSASGFLTLFKNGTSLPAVSSINWFTAGEIVANTTVCQVDAAGLLTAYVPPGASTDFFVDVIGYYQ